MIKFYHASKSLQVEFQGKSNFSQPWGRELQTRAIFMSLEKGTYSLRYLFIYRYPHFNFSDFCQIINDVQDNNGKVSMEIILV